MSTARRENPTSFTNDLEIALYLKLDLLQESIHKIFKKTLPTSFYTELFLSSW